jgi:hypothetical protein
VLKCVCVCVHKGYIVHKTSYEYLVVIGMCYKQLLVCVCF